jgi:hypothetical protein
VDPGVVTNIESPQLGPFGDATVIRASLAVLSSWPVTSLRLRFPCRFSISKCFVLIKALGKIIVPFIQPRQSATIYKEKEVKKNENNNMFDNLLLLTALITTPPKITMSHSMRVLSVTSYAPRYRHSECSWGCMKEARSKARTRRELLQREACKSPSTNLLPGLASVLEPH